MTSPGTDLEKALGHRFADPSLLTMALRHSSLVGAGESGGSNERLEFLGDSLISFLVARELCGRFPEFGEGELSRARASIINNRELCRIGRELGVPNFLQTHESVRGKGGGVSRKMVADAVEALFAAVYLDGGEEAALRLLRRHFFESFRPDGKAPSFDAKTRLQERCQRDRLPLPEYETVSRSGPDHAPRFTVRATVRIGGGMESIATGRSRKEAEGACAALLLERLESEGTER